MLRLDEPHPVNFWIDRQRWNQAGDSSTSFSRLDEEKSLRVSAQYDPVPWIAE
jgi:hypothetical protein